MVAVLAIGTAASIAVPGLHLTLVAPAVDLVLDTITTLVAVSVAALAWVRYRQHGQPVALFQAAAFLVLGIANGLTVAVVMTGLDRPAGMSLAAPGQAPLYVFTAARLLAGALLVAGATFSLGDRRPPRPVWIMAGSGVAIVAVIALAQAWAGLWPLLGSTAAEPSRAGGPMSESPLSAVTFVGAVVQILAAGLFIWAAALSRRLYLHARSIGDAYLAVGLVFAAFAQIQATIFPSTYVGLVTGGDFLRLAFDLILLLGIQASTGALLGDLRTANVDLARLRAIEVERAAADERARLSRELHDGLAQDLWLAKLKTSRLASLPDLGPEATALTDELGAAIDAGLTEAQQAVAALRIAPDPSSPLRELLARCVDDFADRFGLRADIECDGWIPWLTPRTQAELLRITQEALNNVRRHADATVVRVRVTVEDGRLTVVVGDNGCGFDPDAVGTSAYGLASMRERAEMIGAELRIDSRPHDGTRVRIQLPVSGAVPAAAGWPS